MHHIRGSIVRVTVRNFMTHSDCTMKPGPNLNLIIGANGSGKSSLLCAISLGLGGEPKDLGRSNQASAYIKNGASEAWIEVELKETRQGRRNIIVKRVITTGNKENSRGVSKWFINEDKKTQKEVLKILKNFSINVGNLCQVLPQDRVGDFSKFDPVTLLSETIKATLPINYISMKSDIYTLLTTLKTNEKSRLKKIKELEKITKSVERLEEKVSKLKKRQKIEDELNLLEKLKPWLLYQSHVSKLEVQKKDAFDKQSTIDKLHKQSILLTEKLSILLNESNKLKQAQNQVEGSFTDAHEDFAQFGRKLRRKNKQLEDDFHKLNKLFIEKDTVETKIAEAESKVAQFKSVLTSLDDIEGIKDKMKILRSNKKPYDEDLMLSNEAFIITRDKLNILRRELKTLEKSKVLADDEQEKRARYLARYFSPRDHDYYQAVYGFQRKDPFQGKVIGPLVLEIASTKPEFHDYFMRMIKNTVLMSYVTGNRNDRDALVKHNIDTLNTEVRGGRYLFKQARKMKDIPGHETLLNIGIAGFGFEFLSCQEIVLETLYRVTSLSSVLFATSRFEDVISRSNAEEKYREVKKIINSPSVRIISPNFFHELRVSKYSGKIIINTSPIKQRRRKVLFYQMQQNFGGRQSFVPDLDEYKNKKKSFLQMQEKCQALETKVNSIKSQRKAIQQEYKMLEEQKRIFTLTKVKLQSSRQELSVALEGRDRNFTAEQNILEKELVQKLETFEEKYTRTLSNEAGRLVTLESKVTEASLDYSLNAFQTSKTKSEVRSNKTSHAQKKRLLKKLQKIIRAESSKLNKKKVDLEEHIPLQKYQEDFKNTNIRTISELEKKIEELEVELSHTISDQSLLLEYEQGRKQIARLTPEVKNLSETVDVLKTELHQKKNDFETSIKDKVSIITNKYEEFFDTINAAGYKCAGKVKFIKNAPKSRSHLSSQLNLPTAEETSQATEDLNYGVGIFVKFRESQQLELLNSEVQSGGERSLSTFLYLLSLQECSAAPFRVVDEINQGMDSEKERLAFHCLVKNNCGEGLPQYFLITPKLLRGLNFGENVVVHFVENGLYAPKQKLLNLSKLLAKLSNAIEDGDSSDCENDSDMENTPISSSESITSKKPRKANFLTSSQQVKKEKINKRRRES